MQTGLDLAGLVPAIGTAADILNAGISLARGNTEDILWSLAAVVPGGGLAVGAAKIARRATNKTDRLKEHLTISDLDAARREAAGEVVARRPDGTPFDHVQEVRNAQTGLLNRIQRIKNRLGNPNLSASERASLQRELSEASRLLDRSEEFLPR